MSLIILTILIYNDYRFICLLMHRNEAVLVQARHLLAVVAVVLHRQALTSWTQKRILHRALTEHLLLKNRKAIIFFFYFLSYFLYLQVSFNFIFSTKMVYKESSPGRKSSMSKKSPSRKMYKKSVSPNQAASSRKSPSKRLLVRKFALAFFYPIKIKINNIFN